MPCGTVQSRERSRSFSRVLVLPLLYSASASLARAARVSCDDSKAFAQRSSDASSSRTNAAIASWSFSGSLEAVEKAFSRSFVTEHHPCCFKVRLFYHKPSGMYRTFYRVLNCQLMIQIYRIKEIGNSRMDQILDISPEKSEIKFIRRGRVELFLKPKAYMPEY